MRSAGITSVRTTISWYGTAPQAQPSSWDPSDPDDPHYDWSAADTRLREIAAAGITPIVAVNDSPTWARLTPEYGQSPPYPAPFGDFMHAAALRYSGTRPGLPRVRYWMIWIEPNLSPFFTPQVDPMTGEFTAPDRYRAMVNAAYAGIHSAVGDDMVIAGSTAPFYDLTPEVMAWDQTWGPLKFTRRVFCLSDTEPLVPTCSTPVHFDIWSTHPYTSGGPTHHAVLPYDISLGDLPKWRATIDAAAAFGHAVSDTGSLRYWIDEFSWDSNPPDPCAPSEALLARWIPEAFYRMWASGVDLVAWLQLEDEPLATSWYQSGLYFTAPSLAVARPKPFLEAFRFPFVALPERRGVYVWARTPGARPGGVVVQRSRNGRWTTVAAVQADRYGIVQALLPVAATGSFRATTSGERSLPFSIAEPPDRFFNPFGQPLMLEPTREQQCIQPHS